MQLLPSSDWTDVATKTELSAGLNGLRVELHADHELLRTTMELRFRTVEQRFAEVDAIVGAGTLAGTLPPLLHHLL